MDAAVGDESEQVDALAARERPLQRFVLEEGAVLDRLVHTHEVLEEDASRADREVTDLRIPHLAGRESDGLARGGERRVRIGAPEAVEVRRVRELDGVSRSGRRTAPPVEDDQRYERVAARQIEVKDSRSSDAPPTSAPSTSCCASSSSALSGLTEPP